MSALAVDWFGDVLAEKKTNAEDAMDTEVRGGDVEWGEEMTLGELLFYVLAQE